MASPAELNLMWQMLCTAFPQNKAGKDTAGMYAVSLADVDGELLLASAWRTIRSAKREKWGFPEVGEIRRAAVEIVCELKYMAPAWAEQILDEPVLGVLEHVGLPAEYLRLVGEQQRALAAPGGER